MHRSCALSCVLALASCTSSAPVSDSTVSSIAAAVLECSFAGYGVPKRGDLTDKWIASRRRNAAIEYASATLTLEGRAASLTHVAAFADGRRETTKRYVVESAGPARIVAALSKTRDRFAIREQLTVKGGDGVRTIELDSISPGSPFAAAFTTRRTLRCRPR